MNIMLVSHHRADAGDRHPARHRGARARSVAAVSRGGSDALVTGRSNWNSAGDRGVDCARTTDASALRLQCPDQSRGVCVLGRNRGAIRLSSRASSRSPRSDRRVAPRVSVVDRGLIHSRHGISRRPNAERLPRLLGHQTMQMTMRYAHLSPGDLRNEVRLLDDVGSTKRARKGQRAKARAGSQRKCANCRRKARPAGLEPATSWFVGGKRSVSRPLRRLAGQCRIELHPS
jgi:hypothetical protein